MTFEVHPGVWDRWGEVAENAPLLASAPWLELRAPKMDGDTRTYVVSDDGAPVAGVFATLSAAAGGDDSFDVRELLTGSPRTLLDDGAPVRSAMQAAMGADGADLWYPQVAVVYPGYESFMAGPESESPSVAAALVDGITASAREAAAAAVAFLYTRPHDAALVGALKASGFSRVHLTYACDLTLEGSGFDDYLAGLAHKQRGEVRRERRMVAERSVTTGPVALDGAFDALVQLRLQHADRYGRRVSEEKERGRLTQLVDIFGAENVHIFASARDDGSLVSFSLVLEYGGDWYVLDSGADYTDPVHRLTYFEACYYVPITHAYERGIRTLHYGLGSWDAKRRRGCTLAPRAAWVRALTPALAAFLAEWLPRFPVG